MSVDIATLGLAIDSSQAKEADKALDKLAETGKKTEAATKKTTSAFASMSGYIDNLILALKENTNAHNVNTSALGASTAAAIAGTQAVRALTDAEMLASAGASSMADAERLVAAASEQAATEIKKAAEANRLGAEEKRKAAEQAKATALAEKEAARVAAEAAAETAKHEKEAADQAAELAGKIDRLRTSVQPFASAAEKVNSELAEFRALAAAGEFSAEELAQAELVLANRADVLKSKQDLLNASIAKTGEGLKFTAREGLNFTRQLSDIGVTAAMGMSPLMIALQQGPQLFDIIQEKAISSGKTIKQVAVEAGIAIWTAAAPILPIILAIAAAVGTVTAAFALGARAINKDVGDVTKGMGLTEKQLDRVKEKGISTTVTLGDTFKAFFEVAGERLADAFAGPLDWASKKINQFFDDLTTSGADTIRGIVGFFTGAYSAIVATWDNLPQAFGGMAIDAANATLDAFETLINKLTDRINQLTSYANTAAEKVGLEAPFAKLEGVSFGRLNNPYRKPADDFYAAFEDGREKGIASVNRFFDDVGKRAKKNRQDLVKEAAGDAEKEKKSEAEKEFERRLKASQEYLKSLKEETAEIGKNAVQTKLMANERAAAEAPTKALAAAIREASAEWLKATNVEATRKLGEEISDLNTAEQFSISLQGKNAKERAVATAQEQIRLKILAATRAGLTINTAAIEAETAAYVANAAAKGQADLDSENAAEYADEMGRVADQVREAADAMGDFFGKAGEGFAGLLTSVADYGARVAEIQSRLADAAKSGLTSPEYLKAQKDATNDLADAEVDRNKSVLASFKSMFKERSAGYKALEAVEKAYAVVRLANSAKAILQDGIETAASIFNAGRRAVADGIAAVSKAYASIPFPLNIAAGAAVIAALAAIGVRVAGGGGGSYNGPTADDRQDSQGTGSVLGDASARSASLSRALEIAAANSNKDLEYSNQMVRYLRAIENNTSSLSALIAQQLGLPNGAYSTDGLNLGKKSGVDNNTMSGALLAAGLITGAGPIGLILDQVINKVITKIPVVGDIIGGIQKALFGKTTTRTLNDQGIEFSSSTVGDIIANGIDGNTYQEVLAKTKKKFFGFSSTKTKLETYTNEADEGLLTQVGLLIGNLRDGIVNAAGAIGVDSADALLDSFQINIGKISFKDMTGEEITEALNGVFSKLGDDMATAVFGDITKFQKVGEGAFETLVRVARQYQVIDITLTSIGKTFGSVGVSSLEARERLIDLAGSLDEFTEQASFFYENFLSEAEQMSPIINSVRTEMAALGLSGITTKEAFKQLVLGIDVSTEAGAELYSRLMAVAPAFAKVAEYTDELAAKATETLKAAVTAAQDTAEKAAAKVAQARNVLKTAYDNAVNEAKARAKLAADNVKLAEENADKAAAKVAEARNVLKSAYDNVVSDAKNRVAAASEALENSRATLVDSYNKEKDAIVATIEKMKSLVTSLKNFRSSLDNDELAGLSPENAYQKSKEEFNKVASAAANGDLDAIGKLEGVSQSFLKASRDYNASGSSYFDDLSTVKLALDRAISFSENSLSDAELQLQALDRSVETLINIRDEVVNTADAIRAFQEATINKQQVEASTAAELNLLDVQVKSLIQVGDNVVTVREALDQLSLLMQEQTEADRIVAEARVTKEQVDAAVAAEIAALDAQVGALIAINDNVVTVREAIDGLTLAISAQAEADRILAEANADLARNVTETTVNNQEQAQLVEDRTNQLQEQQAAERARAEQLAAEQLAALQAIVDNQQAAINQQSAIAQETLQSFLNLDDRFRTLDRSLRTNIQ